MRLPICVIGFNALKIALMKQASVSIRHRANVGRHECHHERSRIASHHSVHFISGECRGPIQGQRGSKSISRYDRRDSGSVIHNINQPGRARLCQGSGRDAGADSARGPAQRSAGATADGPASSRSGGLQLSRQAPWQAGEVWPARHAFACFDDLLAGPARNDGRHSLQQFFDRLRNPMRQFRPRSEESRT